MRATTPPLLFGHSRGQSTASASGHPNPAPTGAYSYAPPQQQQQQQYRPSLPLTSMRSSQSEHSVYNPPAKAPVEPMTVPMAVPPPSQYHQLVLNRSRPTTPTAPPSLPQRASTAQHLSYYDAPPMHHQEQEYSSNMSSYHHQDSAAPRHRDAVQASIDHYHAKMQQEQSQYQRLEQDELAIAQEEAHLRASLAELDKQRGAVGDDMAKLNDQWALLWDQEEWLQQTPFLDLSREIGEAEFRCKALQNHREDRQSELRGLEIELQRYDGNTLARERIQNALSKVEQCAEKLETHRRTLQLRAEKLFEAETHRDRAALRHLQDVQEVIRRCEATMHGTSSAPASRATSVSSVVADNGISAPPRSRMVSFGPSPVVPRRIPPTTATSSVGSTSSYSAIGGEDSILLDTGKDDHYMSSMLGGESIVMSLTGMKKARRESLAA